MPLYKAMAEILGNMYFISWLTGIAFLLSGAFMINHIVNTHEISKRSYLPGLIYIITASNSTEALRLHPILISNLFLLFAINRLLDIYRREETFSEVFDSGFLIALATLFYFPSIVFFGIILICLLLFHSFIWREWLISIIGFALPFLFLLIYYYLIDMRTDLFSQNIQNFTASKNQDSYSTITRIYIGLVVLILALALAANFTNVKGIKLKTKKSTALVFWYLALSFSAILAFTDFLQTDFALIAAPFSMVFGNYLLNVKRGWWSESLFWILIAASLTVLYNP